MTMEAFTVLTAIAAPMPKPNINTDDIFPGPGASPIRRHMARDAFSDPARMGPNAFAVLRWNEDGGPRPEFILNQPPYDQAKILIAGANFGCGSSREMAVWCLTGIGVRCVIAPSFGDIFYNNCFKNGLLPVRLAQGEVDELLALAADPADARFTVDLFDQTVLAPNGGVRRFEVVEYYRQALLNGLDEISATLTRADRIDAFERDYRGQRGWLAF
jgi:3-isopropylmalate/(R)-2-methylmalate dehydratase small subunit